MTPAFLLAGHAVRNRGFLRRLARPWLTFDFRFVLFQALFEMIVLGAQATNGIQVPVPQAILVLEKIEQILDRQTPGMRQLSRLPQIQASF
jgi:hypothetical protein